MNTYSIRTQQIAIKCAIESCAAIKFVELCRSHLPSKVYPMYTQEKACDLLCENQI